ncbi:MAG TPA: hypothetical protein VFA51_12385 [Candidatus Udaeobacter sp.]|nr:hypothetical protein [Candidatus Udaeobacter sp.]
MNRNGDRLVRRSILTTALAFLILTLGLAPSIQAMPPMSREMSGVVQQITAKTLTLLPAGESKPIVFAWDAKWTQLVRDSDFTSPDALRVGTRVSIRYHSPIFGPQYVTRVFWQTHAPPRSKHENRNGPA